MRMPDLPKLFPRIHFAPDARLGNNAVEAHQFPQYLFFQLAGGKNQGGYKKRQSVKNTLLQ